MRLQICFTAVYLRLHTLSCAFTHAGLPLHVDDLPWMWESKKTCEEMKELNNKTGMYCKFQACSELGTAVLALH